MAGQKREQGPKIIYITKILKEFEFIFEHCSFSKVFEFFCYFIYVLGFPDFYYKEIENVKFVHDIWSHLFSTYAEFSEKLTITP